MPFGLGDLDTELLAPQPPLRGAASHGWSSARLRRSRAPSSRRRAQGEQLLGDGVADLGERDRSHVVGHLGPPEESQRAVQPLERDRPYLDAVLLGEGEEQCSGSCANSSQ